MIGQPTGCYCLLKIVPFHSEFHPYPIIAVTAAANDDDASVVAVGDCDDSDDRGAVCGGDGDDAVNVWL